MSDNKKRKKKKRKPNIKDQVKRGMHLQRIDIVDGQPILKILFPWLGDFDEFKDKIFIDYNKLIKNDYIFIDAEKEISIEIDTHTRSYSLTINKVPIFNETLLFEGNWDDLENHLSRFTGLILAVEYITKVTSNAKQLLIKLLNVKINGQAAVDEMESDYIGFQNLPNKEWYKNGIINPGTLAVGAGLDDKKCPDEAYVIVGLYNECLSAELKEKMKKLILIEDDYATNLSIIIDEKSDKRVLGKIEIMGKISEGEGFEATVPIKVGVNYENFKIEFLQKGYANFAVCSSEDIENECISSDSILCRTQNVVFVDNSSTQLKNWIDPYELDIGGFDAQKKIIVNKENLEIGIYKYFELNKIQKNDVRMIINEILAYRIGIELEIDMASTLYHFEQSTIGVISKLISPPVYKLKDVELKEIKSLKTLRDMVAFDIFLYNTDRHNENICVTEVDGNLKPILIDHTRCFGGYEETDLLRLDQDHVPVYLNHVGLGEVADSITDITDFNEVIGKIQNLDIDRIIHDVFSQINLKTVVLSCNAYNSTNVEDIFINVLNNRKERIESLIRKSLGV